MQTENGQKTVQEVAEMLGISKSLIRFWEEEFTFSPRENGSFSRLEIDQIKAINTMIKEREMSLEDAKIAFLTEKERLELKHKTLDKLIEIRQKLLDLRENITKSGT